MEIASAPRAFAALRADGVAIAWGDPSSGGDAELCEVTAIQVTSRAFAAIKRDGSVVTWGHFGWNFVCLVMFVDFLKNHIVNNNFSLNIFLAWWNGNTILGIS